MCQGGPLLGRKKKQIAEYRYYRMPEGRKVFALLGEKWIQNYGRNIDYLHFHNYMEIGYITHSKVGPGPFGTHYIEALKRSEAPSRK